MAFLHGVGKRRSRPLLLGTISVAFAMSCGASYIRPAAPLTAPWHLCRAPQPVEACRLADEVESWLHDPGLRIVSVHGTSAGIQGARVLTLVTPQSSGSIVFRAKWRAASTRSKFSDPRWELAAHAVQKLFLAPEEYVVPPAAAHCFPLSEYRTIVDRRARETIRTVPCVLGVLSYWLEDARSLESAHDTGLLADDDRAFDPHLFRRSATYRRAIGDMNVLTYLIHHGDSHPKQFLVAGGFENLRVYSVDNSVAFGPFRNPEVVENWAKILVPALPREKIRRLEALTTAQVEGLAVVAQFAIQNDQLVPTAATEPGQDIDRGRRWRGRELQMGLTRDEIRRFRKHLGKLLLGISEGKIQTF